MEIERFDEYLLLTKLGEGETAQVFLALSQGPRGRRTLVVVKRLHAKLASEPKYFELFSREANLTSVLSHPQIVKTEKVGVHRGQPFLAMEHLEGQPLSTVIAMLRAKGRRMSPVLATQIASLALEGLCHAHDACDYTGEPLGVVHCDVSPHNLFVTYDGQVKLLDFGIARLRARPLTTDAPIRGTRAYVAPEQALGEDVDARADVWSMAVTLWECLVGRPLFHGETNDDVLRAALTDEIQPPNEVAHGVPDALSRILDGALSRNRERRFESALAFKKALDGWLATQVCDEPSVAVSRVLASLFAAEIEAYRRRVQSYLSRVDALLPAQRKSRSSGAPSQEQPSLASVSARASVPTLALASVAPPPLPLRTSLVHSSADTASRKPTKPRSAWSLRNKLLAASAAAAALFGLAYLESGGASRAKPRLVGPAAAAPVHPTDVPRNIGPADATRSEPGLAVAAPLAPAPKVVARDKGRLKLESLPRAEVSLNGQLLGTTPIDVELPAQDHLLMLKDVTRGIQASYSVTVHPGQTLERHVAIE